MAQRTITGFFARREGATAAVEELLALGYAPHDISILMADPAHGREFTIETQSKASEGCALGVLIGGVLVGIVGGVLAEGTIEFQAFTYVATGPLVAVAIGFGIGAFVGGLIGALLGLAVPEHVAHLFGREIEGEGVLVGLTARSEHRARAREIFKRHGARRVRG